jgi:hypothetical protein
MTSADHLDPYAARLRLSPLRGSIERPRVLIATLLEEIGRSCLNLGASLIGHVKCHVVCDPSGRFHASLTSLRSGTHVAGDAVSEASILQIELVVLVYGLDLGRIDDAVARAIDCVTNQNAISWTTVQDPAGAGHHLHPGGQKHDGHD